MPGSHWMTARHEGWLIMVWEYTQLVVNTKGWIDLKDKVGVLVTGTAALKDGGIINSPATLSGSNFVFSKEARVFLRNK